MGGAARMIVFEKGRERDIVNNIKGIAIILIVIGHNNFITSEFKIVYKFLYSFHVSIFFMILGLRNSPVLNGRYIADVFIRYFTPYCFFVIGLWAVNSLVNQNHLEFGESVMFLFASIFIGTAQLLDRATGAQLYWFLPALISSLLLWSLWGALGKLAKRLVLALMIISHLLMGLIPISIVTWIPLGLFPTVFLFVFVLAAKTMFDTAVRLPVHSLICSGITLLVCGLLIFYLNIYVNVGYSVAYSIVELDLFVIQEITIVSGFVFVSSLAAMTFLPNLIGVIGKASLHIFLVHQVVFQAIWQLRGKIEQHFKSVDAMIVSLGLGGIMLVVSIGAGVFVFHVFERYHGLRKVIFPKNVADWALAERVKQVKV